MNNLSEEEKKSIEILKDFSENENTAYCYDWNGFNYEVILEAITEVLNLIEKQQKELEQEKEKNKELEEQNKYIKNHIYNKEFIELYYIPKFRVKEKIETWESICRAEQLEGLNDNHTEYWSCFEDVLEKIKEQLLQEGDK